MNTAAVATHMPSNLARQALGTGCAVVAGCLLFFASRRLAWGRDQSFADWPLWAIAAVPYFAYFGAVRFSAKRFAEFVRQSDFLSIWTVSLFAFVMMRTSSLSWLYESGIYNTTVAGIGRYAIISAVYVSFGFLAVNAWHLMFVNRLSPTAMSITARAVGFVVAFMLFCSGIFLIAP